MIPSTFEELVIYLGLLAIGWLLFLLGNLLVGHKREGGKRLVLFAVGGAMAALALTMCRIYWPACAAQMYPAALGFYFGIGLFAIAGVLLGVAAMAANEKVRSWFVGMWRGL